MNRFQAPKIVRVDTQVTRDAGDLLPLVRSHGPICVGQAKEEGDELNPVLNAHVPTHIGTDVRHGGFFLNDAFKFAEALLGLGFPKPLFKMGSDKIQFPFIDVAISLDDHGGQNQEGCMKVNAFGLRWRILRRRRPA